MRIMRRMAAATAVVAAALLTLTNAGTAGSEPVAKGNTEQVRSIIADTMPRPAGLPAPTGERVAPPGISADVAANLDGPFYIVNYGTGRCLDAHYGDGGGNGNRVGLWDCNGGITEQWYVYNNGSTGNYWMTIINARNGRSLDYPASSGGANGWQYLLWDFVNSSGQQYWPYHHGGGEYEFSVLLGGGANVMDAFASDGGGNGNRVGNWSITGSPLQRWYFASV